MTGRYKDLRQSFYDVDWNLLPFNMTGHPHHDQGIIFPKPKSLSKMIELARKLSEDFAFVRVDFYDVEGQIFFGELTFTPANGYAVFIPRELDTKYGDMLQLPVASEMFNRFR